MPLHVPARVALLRSRIIRALLALAVACGLVTAAVGEQDSSGESEVRALWVTRQSLASPELIAAMVESARTNRFNTLLVQARARGDAYFNGGVEARAAALDRQPSSFDPLQTVLMRAHAAGLLVHAWINIGLIASAVDLPSARTHAVFSHPEWLMVPRAIAPQMALLNPKSQLYLDKLARWVRGQSAEIEGLYLSPVPAGAADYTVAVVSDLAARYALDGVHVDYARYPTDEFDYSREALAAFASEVIPSRTESDARRLERRASTTPLAYADAFPDRWREFGWSDSPGSSGVWRRSEAWRRGAVHRRGVSRRQRRRDPPAAGLEGVDCERLTRRDLPEGLRDRRADVHRATGHRARWRRNAAALGRHRRVPPHVDTDD
jgi:hypothetical protein